MKKSLNQIPKSLLRDNKIFSYKLNGYLTVFLSLSLTLLLGIFFFLIRASFINFSKMKLECVTDIGMNAVLGEYHRELLNQYDLLFIDMSYGTSNGGVHKLENHLSGYINQNLCLEKNNISSWNRLTLQNVEITETLKPHHYDGKILRRQACAYISENIKTEVLSDLTLQLAQAESLDGTDEMASWQNVMTKIASILSLLTKEARQQALSGNPEAEIEKINITIDNPAEKIFNNANQQLDHLVSNSHKGGNINLSDYYSHRASNNNDTNVTIDVNVKNNPNSNSNSNIEYEASFIDDITSMILFRAYIFEKLGYHKNEKADSLLDYQIEYLIIGTNSDEKNLQGIKARIFSWRLADNVRLYFSDSVKRKEAYTTASAISSLILHPELTHLIANSLLFSWAFADSLDDTDKIIDGGKVPLIKKSVESTENGLSYYQYLELMLMITSEVKILARVMDIIEMDIRLTSNNQHFRIDLCLESYRATLDYYDRYESYSIDRRYGY
ncbi:MAG: DUF5702 domain-containing protein [Lachnospiraceae bacterium]|nr:DUF5702 domain-containing protein [Lachnospiraceae bacterium]